MGPLWEDVLMKGSKFYAAIKYVCKFFHCFFSIPAEIKNLLVW